MPLTHRLVLIATVAAAAVLIGAANPSSARTVHVASNVRAEYRRPAAPPHPEDNRPSAARVALGKALFFDTRLSGSKDISCATCHRPDRAWGDGRPTAIGTGGQVLGRRTPTVLNTAWAEAFFWDGRAATLEEQALGPIQAAPEMNMGLDSLMARLRAVPGYRALFRNAYGGEPSPELVGKAIAAFERTIVSGTAPFDRWIAGDERAISESAKRGFAVFTGRGACAQCHSGWRLTDDSFHDIGVAGADSGRAKVLPGIAPMEFAFKTPTLRNVVERAPYMHAGTEETLEAVIELYDRGGRVKRPSLSPLITPLGLSAAEKRDLVAFLRTLSSKDPVVHPPALPR